MTDLEMYSLLLGAFLPLAISVVQQPGWSDKLRAVVALLICVVADIPLVYFQGDFTGRRLVSSALLVLVTAYATFRNFWKPTGAAPTIEDATSPNAGNPPNV